jgi:hypothetical protein
MTETKTSQGLRQLRELWGTRFGSERELQGWFEGEMAHSHGRCHFCGEEFEDPQIDFREELGPQGLNLVCVVCYNLRRQIPYELVKAHARSLKHGERRWCGGETHNSLEERVIVPQRFEPDFSICKNCWEHSLKKRRVNWQDYVRSWTDESDWRNKGLPKETLRESARQKTTA